jgi:enoyl-CoA hydratase/carnithine racemase
MPIYFTMETKLTEMTWSALPAADGATVHARWSGAVAHIQLCRSAKRNAMNSRMVAELHQCMLQLPSAVRVAILTAEGAHFCAGLDLSDIEERDPASSLGHSRRWHAAFDEIQLGRIPVIAVLQGAVVGGGMELASACHLRVAEPSTYFGLPEAQRGIFVGGGGSVRIPRLIGVSRMTDMMLTGRLFDAAQAEAMGLVNYTVPAGTGWAKALELAERVASNAPLSNFAVTHALPRIADQPHADGLLMESLMAALVERGDETRDRLRAFLDKQMPKVKPQAAEQASLP